MDARQFEMLMTELQKQTDLLKKILSSVPSEADLSDVEKRLKEVAIFSKQSLDALEEIQTNTAP